MRFLSEAERAERARAFPVGARVVARRFRYDPAASAVDDNVTVPPGTRGVVTGAPDATGSVPVRWENGHGISFLVEDDVELEPMSRWWAPDGYVRVVTDEEVGTLATTLTRRGAQRVADRHNAGWEPVEYRPRRRGWFGWRVVAFQSRLMPARKDETP